MTVPISHNKPWHDSYKKIMDKLQGIHICKIRILVIIELLIIHLIKKSVILPLEFYNVLSFAREENIALTG